MYTTKIISPAPDAEVRINNGKECLKEPELTKIAGVRKNLVWGGEEQPIRGLGKQREPGQTKKSSGRLQRVQAE